VPEADTRWVSEPLKPSDCIDGDGVHVTGFALKPDEYTDVIHSYVCSSLGCESYVKIQHVQLVEVGHVTCMMCLKPMELAPGSLH